MTRFVVVVGLLLAAAAGGAAFADGERPIFLPVTRELVPTEAGDVNEILSFDFVAKPLPEVLDFIARRAGKNIIHKDLEGDVTLRLDGVDWRKALEAVAQQQGLWIREEGEINYVTRPKTVRISVPQEAPIRDVVTMVAQLSGANIVVGPEVKGNVSANLDNVPWPLALETIVRSAGLTVVTENGGLVNRVTDPKLVTEQLSVRVYHLKFIMSPDPYQAVIDSKYAKFSGEIPKVGTMFGAQGAGAGIAATLPGAPGAGAAPTAAPGGGGEQTQFALIDVVGKMLSARGSIRYDPLNNAVIAIDTEPNLREIDKIIKTLDREPPMVFVDVKFVTTSCSDTLDFGVNWANGFDARATGPAMWHKLPFSRGHGGWENQIALNRGAFDQNDVDVWLQEGEQSFPAGGQFRFGILDFQGLDATMRALKTDNTSDIKQSPKIITLDNQAATIFVGDTIRFAETPAQSGTQGGVTSGIVEARTSPVDTGFQLLIIPHVVRGTNKLILTVIPKSEFLTGTTSPIPGFDRFESGGFAIDLPQVSATTMITKMILRDGETAVLGGLVTESASDTIRKIPLLGDIPILGWLFKNKVTSTDKRNLILLMTVKIVHGRDDVRDIYVEHRGRLGTYDNYWRDVTDDEMKAWRRSSDKIVFGPAA
jgi:type IV pilus assembly protein PilQ